MQYYEIPRDVLALKVYHVDERLLATTIQHLAEYLSNVLSYRHFSV